MADHALPAPEVHPRALVDAARLVVERAGRRARAWVGAAITWLRGRPREQYLWAFLALVLLAYLAVLFTASTGTGRGGR
jgi:phytoene/squalene synthetase